MDNKMKKFCDEKLKSPDYYNCTSISDIKSSITVLLGPNGTGKSTSIKSMIAECKNKHLDYVFYSTSKNDIVSVSSKPFGNWDVYGISCAFHSEGERMNDSFYKWLDEECVPKLLKSNDPIYIFIDEYDSGLSIDMIIYSLRGFLFVLNQELERRPVYVVISSNSYELCSVLKKSILDVKFIWLPSMNEMKFSTYDDYILPYIDYYNEVYAQGEFSWMKFGK